MIPETFEWIEKNGYKVSDEPRESYIDGMWNKEEPEEWLTEIQIPVTDNSDLFTDECGTHGGAAPDFYRQVY